MTCEVNVYIIQCHFHTSFMQRGDTHLPQAHLPEFEHKVKVMYVTDKVNGIC